MSAVPRRCISPSGSPSTSVSRKSISSVRSSITPARTRSTMCWARSCWRGAWARSASSPRPAPASTASPPPPPAPCSTSTASSTWAPPTSNVSGTVAGPHPYPAMVRDFQCVIGNETRAQIMKAEGRLPDTLVACIGGGSNAMGLFHPFLDDPSVRMIGVEAGGHGIDTGRHAASLNGGLPGVLHGNRTYLLQDDDGQIKDAHSISAGLDYPGIGPEHAWLNDTGRVDYVSITDREALAAFQLCSRLEGIIPALEPAHALAHVGKIAPDLPPDHLIVMNLCGRGDKDIFAVADHLGVKL